MSISTLKGDIQIKSRKDSKKNKEKSIRNHWQNQYRTYGYKYGYDSSDSMNKVIAEIWREIAKYGVKCNTVLDFGCGIGLLRDYIITSNFATAYYGCDILDTLIFEHLPGEYLTIRPKDNSIPLPDNSVDAVFVIFVFEYMINESHFQRACSEIRRVLKDEGSIYIVERTEQYVFNTNQKLRSNDILKRSLRFDNEITIKYQDFKLVVSHELI